MSHVFISYRHTDPDTGLAHEIATGCMIAGHTVFIDRKLTVGMDWSVEIETQIKQCDFFVVLISKDVLNSEMVQAEIRLAHQRSKREQVPKILPVRVAYAGPLDYELDSYLTRIQFTLWESAADSTRIIAELIAAMTPQNDASVVGALLPGDAQTGGDACEDVKDYRRPLPTVDQRAFKAPGGNIKVDDPFYILRPCDAKTAQSARQDGETIVIKASRQMGKSSLLLRYLADCVARNKRIALLDFSIFAETELESFSTILSEIAAFLTHEFRLQHNPMPSITSQRSLSYFMEDIVFPAIPEPMVLAFDEVDRVMGRPYQHDFFTMLRMWHNKRAEPNSPWARVDLALVISTEPALLIDSLDRSPFNVAPPIIVEPFTLAHYAELNQRYGSPLAAAELSQLFELLGGHPYLTRLAFYQLVATDAWRFATLMDAAADDYGPFGDHLRAWLLKLRRHAEVLDALRQMMRHGTIPREELFYRLYGAGLVQRTGQRIHPANQLYQQFFGRVL